MQGDNLESAQRMSVIIPTTLGPVAITGLIELAGEGGRSAMCLDGTTTLIGIASGYNAFVRRSTGVINRLYGKTPPVDYRLDVADNVEAGASWQLAVLLSHALWEDGRRLETATRAQGPLVWATGAISPVDFSVGSVGHVADKLRNSRPLFEAAVTNGRTVHIFIPQENERDIEPDIAEWLAKRNLKPVLLGSADAAFAALGLPAIPRAASRSEVLAAAFSGNPYRGLQPYQRQHRALFFGRTKAREEALEKLRIAAGHGRPFLLVHGQSGVGKSSLVQAGLAADVEERAHEGGRFRSVVVSPSQGAGDPVSALCHGLRGMLDMPAEAPDGASYANDGHEVIALLQALRVNASSGPKKQSGLLIIDQLEEIFEPTVKAERAVEFGNQVERIVGSGVVWVVATMRADAIGQLDRVPALAHLASADRVYRLDRPSRLELLEIVAAPAALAGKTFPDRSIPEQFADIAAASPDSLPLLQSVLYLFFDQADGKGQLTPEGLKRIGGFEGAVGRWADKARSEIIASGSAIDLVDRVLVSLVRIEPETRRPLARSLPYKPDSGEGKVLKQLADVRLVSLFDGTDGPRARLAHEVLATHWPHLAILVERLAAAIILRDDLEERASAWIASGHEESELLRGAARLDGAQIFLREALVPFETAVKVFVSASVAVAQEEASKVHRLANAELERARVERNAATARSRAARNFVRLAAIASIVLAGFAAFAGWQWSQAIDARQAAEASATREKISAAQANEAAEKERISAAAAKDSAERERIAAAAAKDAADKETMARRTAEDQAKRADEQAEKAVRAENESRQQLQSARINAARFIAGRAEQMKDENIDLARLALVEILPDTMQGDETKPMVPEAISAMAKLNTSELPRMLYFNALPAISRRMFSPDWKLTLAAFDFRFATILDTITGTLMSAIAAENGNMTEMQFSPDAKYALLTTIDTVQLWDWQTGKKVGTFSGHRGAVTGARFNARGDKITTVAMDGTIRIWDRKLQDVLHEFLIDAQDTPAATIYPIYGNAIMTRDETRLIYSSIGGQDRLYNVETEELIATFDGQSGLVDGPILSADGRLFVNGGKDKVARIWDTGSGELVRTLEGHTKTVNGAFFNADSTKILTYSEDGSARIWDTATGEPLQILSELGSPVLGATLSADGAKLATWSQDKILRIWDVNSRTITRKIAGHPFGFTAAVFSPEGRYLATSSPQTPAEIWDLSAGSQLRTVSSIPGTYARSAINHDGTQLLMTTYKSTGGYRLDLANAMDGTIVRTFADTSASDTDGIVSAIFSPDGQRVAVSTVNGRIRIWETGTGKELKPISDFVMKLGKPAFSPDNRRIVALTNYNVALVRDVDTGAPVANLVGHGGAVSGASFSPDGHRIVTTSNDNTVKVWNADNGQVLETLGRQSVPTLDAIFSPDGQKILFASSDGSVRIWSLRGNNRLKSLGALGWVDSYSGSGYSMQFDPDGQRAAIISPDASVRLFDTQTGAQLERIAFEGSSPVTLTYGANGLRVVSVSVGRTDISELGSGASQKDLFAREHLLSYRSMTEAERADLFPDSDRTPAVAKLAEMNPCDRLAANPSDLRKPNGAGVEFDAISGFEAMGACNNAVAIDPKNARYKYQLGRAFSALKQYNDAFRAFRQAADQGYPIAYDALGLSYQQGQGTPADLATARQMFARAAEAGAPSAYMNMAFMAQYGVGETVDLAKAKGLMEKAAEAGVPSAQEQLARGAEVGSPGSAPDLQDALFHYAMATILYENSGDDGLALRNRFRRAGLARLLSPHQVAAVWAKVLDWRNEKPPRSKIQRD